MDSDAVDFLYKVHDASEDEFQKIYIQYYDKVNSENLFDFNKCDLIFSDSISGTFFDIF